MKKFKSIFSAEMDAHIAIRASVYSEMTVVQNTAIIGGFDDYLCDIDLQVKELTERTVEGWIQKLSGKTHTIGCKVSQLRLFCQFLQTCGIVAYMPPAYKTRDEYIPYLFSDEEYSEIFNAADNICFSINQTNPWIQIEIPVILRLLYSCGLRLGETITLKMQNIDLDGGFLILVRTKNQKQRIVPLSISMHEILSRYCAAMNIASTPTAYVFPGKTLDFPISQKAVRRQFDRLMRELGIGNIGRQQNERGACMHCFRHSFAFKSFAQAEQSGRSLNDSIPFLSTYLGHKSLNETEKYLKFSSTMYPDALSSFESYIGDIFPEVTYEELF